MFTGLGICMFLNLFSQEKSGTTLSGKVVDAELKEAILFANVVLLTAADSTFITGTLSTEEGYFTVENLASGNYILRVSYIGYQNKYLPFFVGKLSPYLDLGQIELMAKTNELGEIVVTEKRDVVSAKMDKKTYTVADNISQSGGSLLQAMSNLPGVTIDNGKVLLRGNSNIMILIDGKQTALTGFNAQGGLDNIPASAIERIEIINNPSAKYDANGNGGIINVILKKENKEGFNGKAGIAGGLGALWIKKQNLPTIRPQYQNTPKINPSLSVNYRKKKINLFAQADYLYTHTLNKNEFVTRYYDDGNTILQQTKRNRKTGFLTSKMGFDWYANDRNTVTISGLYGSEKILDNGDEPFFYNDLSSRSRLWQFLEDELKTTIMASSVWQHKFAQPGHTLSASFNYTFHRENEKYFFDNIYPSYTGHDAFKLLSDENVGDFMLDYNKPLKYGRLETGIKVRRRFIPTNMQFFPGLNSPIDSNAGGWANYKETIPAAYGNYVFENNKFEAEAGLRVEYANIQYEVNPDHPTYKSNGYSYFRPFPNLRFAYKASAHTKLSLFYNRRVDRPNEVDIRIFPKYDDAEIIKVGNPALKPQFTQSIELGLKKNLKEGYFYAAAYHKITDGTITRISSTVPGNTIIYAVFQNAGKSYMTGVELLYAIKTTKWLSINMSVNAYHNQINAFSVLNKYPVAREFTAKQQEIISGNAKLNAVAHSKNGLDIQLSAIYLAPDIIPQGKMARRFTLNAGIKKSVQKGKAEIYGNATDLLNTMVITKTIYGDGFHYNSSDYYETQVIRLGYNYKF